MADPGAQCRREDASIGHENDQLRDERDDIAISEPPSWNQEDETMDEYSDRVLDWVDQEIDKNPSSKEEIRRRSKIAINIARHQQDRANEERRKRNEEIRRKTNELRKRNEEIRKETEELKKELQKEIERKSVKRMQEIHGGYPALERNCAAIVSLPSWYSNRKRDSEGRDGGVGDDRATKYQKLNHNSIEIKDLDPFDLSETFEQFEVNYFYKKNGEVQLEESAVAAELHDKWDVKGIELRAFSEAGVIRNVRNIVRDAADCLGLHSTKLLVERDISFFSMEYDVLIVHYMGSTIMCIKVENPGLGPEALMKCEVTATQCLDYTYALRNRGIDIPIVCLTNYSFMSIGSCKESIQSVLEATLPLLKKVSADNRFSCDSKTEKDQQSSLQTTDIALEMSCDGKISKEEVETPKMELDGEDQTVQSKISSKGVANDEHNNDCARKMYFSEPIGLKNILQGFYLAIACACVSAESPNSTGGELWNSIIIPDEGEEVKNKWYNVVTTNSSTWKKVNNTTVTFALKTDWSDSQEIYMSDVIGKGQTGKVFLCMDSTGHHFALKMLFPDSPAMQYGYCDPERMQYLVQNIELEAKRWTRIYPDYKKSIWVGTLNGFPCIAMPFVAWIPRSRREDLREDIKKEIERFADLGFVYKSNFNVGWHLVRLRTDEPNTNKIILKDLESKWLEEKKEMTKEERDAAIDNFMSKLYSRA